MPDFDTLVTGLRAGTRHQDDHRKAAVELLISHEYWLHRKDFSDSAVRTDDLGETWIKWNSARLFLDRGPRASTSELAVLDFAVALGEDKYRFNHMGDAHAAAITRAVQAALGTEHVHG